MLLKERKYFIKVSKNTDQYKQTVERLTLENADLQSKLDAHIADLKKEKLARKTVESKLQLSEDEVSEVRASMASMQKLMDERKRKSDAERAHFDTELDELKKAHETELLVLRSVMMTPFVADPNVKAFYRSELIKAFEGLLGPSRVLEAAGKGAAR